MATVGKILLDVALMLSVILVVLSIAVRVIQFVRGKAIRRKKAEGWREVDTVRYPVNSTVVDLSQIPGWARNTGNLPDIDSARQWETKGPRASVAGPAPSMPAAYSYDSTPRSLAEAEARLRVYADTTKENRTRPEMRRHEPPVQTTKNFVSSKES